VLTRAGREEQKEFGRQSGPERGGFAEAVKC
jgi:hypothetical protein